MKVFVSLNIFLIFLFLNSDLYGQHIYAADRKTGRLLTCEEQGCIDNGGNYEDESRACLNCYMRIADSVLKIEVSNFLGSIKNNPEKKALFLKRQTKWEKEVKRKATLISNQYKGGTMEMTEYVREILLQTKRRVEYLKTLNSKSK